MTPLLTTLCTLCRPPQPGTSVDALSVEQWQELWKLALRHKVGPLLVSRLNHYEITPPAPVASAFSILSRKSLFQGFQHSAELARLTQLFNSSDIAFLNFKGLALMNLTGLELTQRHIGDMDLLLIHPEDLVQADRLLLEAGYLRLTLPDSLTMTPAQQRYFLQSEKDVVYHHIQKNIKLELHFKLFLHRDIFPITTSDLYDQRQEIVIGKTRVPVMSKEDHQIYLLLHGSFAAWFRLKWLCDIPSISNNGADYATSDFENRMCTLGVERPCIFGLQLANTYLSMPISPAVRKRSEESRAIGKLIKHAEKSLVRKEKPLFSIRTKMVYWFYDVFVYQTRLLPKFSTKLKLIKSYSTRTSDWEVIKFPDYLFWLYIFLRPVLWLVRQCRKSK